MDQSVRPDKRKILALHGGELVALSGTIRQGTNSGLGARPLLVGRPDAELTAPALSYEEGYSTRTE